MTGGHSWNISYTSKPPGIRNPTEKNTLPKKTASEKIRNFFETNISFGLKTRAAFGISAVFGRGMVMLNAGGGAVLQAQILGQGISRTQRAGPSEQPRESANSKPLSLESLGLSSTILRNRGLPLFDAASLGDTDAVCRIIAEFPGGAGVDQKGAVRVPCPLFLKQL